MQLDQRPGPQWLAELARRVFALPDVEERSSAISVPGARALWLREGVPAGPREAFLIGREFAHLHPLPDGSLHLALPPDVGREAMEQGWAEPHPVARLGLIPSTIVMVYAPRDAEEVEVVFELVRASLRFARGEEAPDA